MMPVGRTSDVSVDGEPGADEWTDNRSGKIVGIVVLIGGVACFGSGKQI